MKRILVAGALGAALLATPTLAHVVLAAPQATPDSYYVGDFRVSHGCGESPTVAVRVEFPADVAIARPQPKAGWAIEIEHQPVTTPVLNHGQPLTERVSAITWRGRLGPDQYDAFSVLMRLPAREGAVLFRVVQTCEVGSAEWTPALELHSAEEHEQHQH